MACESPRDRRRLFRGSGPRRAASQTAAACLPHGRSQTLRACLDRLAESLAGSPRLRLLALLYEWKAQEGGFRVVEELLGKGGEETALLVGLDTGSLFQEFVETLPII